MPSNPAILAFDTSAAHCAVALLKGGEIVARAHEEMARGQAERLPVMVDEVLDQAGADWEELDAIGVGVGPGNFTGIRIGISFARGLALALGVPAIGVSGLEIVALSENRPDGRWKNLLQNDLRGIARLPGPGTVVFQQHFGGISGSSERGPEVAPLDVDGKPFRASPIDWSEDGNGLTFLVGLAAERLAEQSNHPRPTPLYVRPADAAPPRHKAPVIVP